MERLTRRNKQGEARASKLLHLMALTPTSEGTLIEILEKLADYEDLEEKAGYDLSTVVHELSSEILRLKDKIIELENNIEKLAEGLGYEETK